MGGYDFPGSTSCEDLHVLTGWIPERVGLSDESKSNSDGKLDVERMFDRMVSGAKFGDCLITIASRDMPDEVADKLGLVPSHAYAVLRVVKLGTHKFLLIKNPWAQTRWKGRFSAEDTKNWTPQLREALSYNPESQMEFDNGIFWMELNDVRDYFSAVYLNWNPELFTHRITQHGFWNKNIGPRNDTYNLGYNPQFTLDVDYKGGKASKDLGGSVWILLSKHMENTKRFEQDKNDFLTLHVYDESAVGTKDRRIFYRKDALHKGVYINSPHYLLRIDVSSESTVPIKGSIRRYTVVISQYEKKHNVAFSMTAYSTLPARFRPIDDRKYWKFSKVMAGAWTVNYNGGCPNFETFPNNPQFRLHVSYATEVRLMLEAPVDYSVNIMCYLCVNAPKDDEYGVDESKSVDDSNVGKIVVREHYRKELMVGDSGTYRHGVTYVDVKLNDGVYIIIISTFKPEQNGAFKLTVKATEEIRIKIVA